MALLLIYGYLPSTSPCFADSDYSINIVEREILLKENKFC